MAHAKLTRELRYEYGFRAPNGEIVQATDLAEAQFFAGEGAELMLREVRTTIRDWTAVMPS